MRADFTLDRATRDVWTSRPLISSSETIFKITHDGPGIDVSQLPAQLETAAVERSWLRGFVLIPSVMDDLRYDDHGRTLCLLNKAAANDEAELEWE